MVEAGAKRVLAADPNEDSHERAAEHGIEVRPFEQVMAHSDLIVATTGVAGLIEPEMVRDGSVILALTNPDPEIRPADALAAGAAFAADGSLVNNVLGFPGIFRGALASGATEISTSMKLARRPSDRRPDQAERARPRRARPGRAPRGRPRGRAGRPRGGPEPLRPHPLGVVGGARRDQPG